MRIILLAAFIIYMSSVTMAQSNQPAKSTQIQDQQGESRGQMGQTLSPCDISELPWRKRPRLTLGHALELAEKYLRQEKIDMSDYYLFLAKPNTYKGEQGWLFRWARTENKDKGEGYIEINVSMEGKVSRL